MNLREVAIFTANVNSVADFYERLLGRAPSHRGDGIAVFKIGDAKVLIHAPYSPGPSDPPCENHTAFAVADLDRALADLEKRGLTVDIPAREYEWGRSAYLRDPDGQLLELHECTQ